MWAAIHQRWVERGSRSCATHDTLARHLQTRLPRRGCDWITVIRNTRSSRSTCTTSASLKRIVSRGCFRTRAGRTPRARLSSAKPLTGFGRTCATRLPTKFFSISFVGGAGESDAPRPVSRRLQALRLNERQVASVSLQSVRLGIECCAARSTQNGTRRVHSALRSAAVASACCDDARRSREVVTMVTLHNNY
jgi:hypothetical protein